MSILGSAKRLSRVHRRSYIIKEGAMKYLYLLYLEEKKVNVLSKNEKELMRQRERTTTNATKTIERNANAKNYSTLMVR